MTRLLNRALKEHKNMKWVSLSCNKISQTGATALKQAVEANKGITTLKVWDNKAPKGTESISEDFLDELKELCDKNKDAANFDPHLANAKKVEVIPDKPGAVVKHVFTEGSGDTPAAGAQVKAHYTGTLTNGEKFDSSRDRGDPFDFTLGQGQVIGCWDKGFATMRKGEKAMLTCKSEYAYGEQGSPPKIPGGATLKFDVELIDFTGPKKEL